MKLKKVKIIIDIALIALDARYESITYTSSAQKSPNYAESTNFQGR